MQFEYTEPQSELERLICGHFSINIFGKILPGDDEKFRKFIAKVSPPPRTSVYIDSVGGDVEAAIGIGRLIRKNWYSTSIGRYALDYSEPVSHLVPRKLIEGKCLSAATLIYIGGRLRFISKESEFGVHQFSFKNPTPDHIGRSQSLSASIARYVSDMGIGPTFLELSSSTPRNQIQLLGLDRLKELGVITGGDTEVTWTVQARGQMIYVRGERDSLFGHHKMLLGYTKSKEFLLWAVIEAQGREEELTKFGLVEVVFNGDDLVIDVSHRCERLVAGSYVNIFAKISDEECTILANSDGFGLRVRFSTEAPLFLGISPMSTEGGREELATFYQVLSKEKDGRDSLDTKS